MDKLLKRLREISKRLKELRAIDTDDFTDELTEELESLVEERDSVNKKVELFQRADKQDEEEQRTVNGQRPVTDDLGDGRITVEDQPIYRGRFAAGMQMRDLIDDYTSHGSNTEARSRLQQCNKREMEVRAVGTGLNESVATEGGFLLQGEQAIQFQTNGWNNSFILSRTDNMTIGGNWYDEIGIDETSRADGSRAVTWYSSSELSTLTSSNPKFKKTRWEPHKLTALYYMSGELDADVPAMQSTMRRIMEDELAFKKQALVYAGSGVGEALGLLTSNATVSVAKETGQAATTIVHRNTTKMLSRIHLQNLSSCVWMVNQDTLDQLLNLTISVGTGGTVSSAFMPNYAATPGMIGTLHGFPVVPLEQCKTLGTAGDIMIADLSQYRTVDKGGVESAVSMHVQFINDQLTIRFITRFDGQPKMQTALTPNQGSNTVSSQVILAARA